MPHVEAQNLQRFYSIFFVFVLFCFVLGFFFVLFVCLFFYSGFCVLLYFQQLVDLGPFENNLN